MKPQLQDQEQSTIATSVAPEDVRQGDYVAVLSEIVELPTFLWCETLSSERRELVRLRRLPTADRVPLEVKAICLPFVFVKLPGGRFETIDIRLASLVRLDKAYAKKVWKSLRARPSGRSQTC